LDIFKASLNYIHWIWVGILTRKIWIFQRACSNETKNHKIFYIEYEWDYGAFTMYGYINVLA
jgi:hypothetical protein